MTNNNWNILKYLIRITVTVVLLILVFSKIEELRQLEQTVKTTRWEFLIGLWVLTILIYVLSSIKMKFILRKQSCNVKIDTLFGASALTLLYSMIMPGLLSTGVKWYVLKKDTGKGTNVFSSMVYNQLTIMIVMATFGLAALVVTNPTALLLTNPAHKSLLPIVCSILLTVIIIISMLLLNRRTGGRFIKSIKYLIKPLPQKFHQKGELTLDQIGMFQVVGWRFHISMTFLTIAANIGGGVLSYILAAKAANITVPAAVLVWLCAIIFVLGRIPISIANLGVREWTMVGLLAIYGVATSAAVLMSIIIFSNTILMAVIGAGYQLRWAVKTKEFRVTS